MLSIASVRAVPVKKPLLELPTVEGTTGCSVVGSTGSGGAGSVVVG